MDQAFKVIAVVIESYCYCYNYSFSDIIIFEFCPKGMDLKCVFRAAWAPVFPSMVAVQSDRPPKTGLAA